MFQKPIRAAVALTLSCLLWLGACGVQPSHPNQIDSFDGATYDSLLAAKGALDYLRARVASGYPEYVAVFNQANASYGLAYTTYVSFRTTPSTQAEVALAVGNLSLAIVTLENAFQIGLQAKPSQVAAVRMRAHKLRASARDAGITLSSILTELQIAAAVASTIAPTSVHAALAQLVIGSAAAALSLESSAVGQPIDLTLLAPLPSI